MAYPSASISDFCIDCRIIFFSDSAICAFIVTNGESNGGLGNCGPVIGALSSIISFLSNSFSKGFFSGSGGF